MEKKSKIVAELDDPHWLADLVFSRHYRTLECVEFENAGL